MKSPESPLPESSNQTPLLAPAGPLPSEWFSTDVLSDILHRAGHDIGNPLTAIISLASILEFSSSGPAPGSPGGSASGLPREKMLEYSLSINAEAWKISHLVERLVMIFSQRAGNPADHSIGEIAERVLQRLRSRQKIEDLHVESDFFFAPTAARVRGDGDQLFLLISEIFLNAHTFHSPIPADSSEDASSGKTIHCSLVQEEGRVLLQFRNPFVGPYEGDIRELLQPMRCGVVKAQGEGNEKGKPAKVLRTGIGLPAVWAIVHRQGGTLAIGQEHGPKGWEFVLEIGLPLADESND